MFGMGALRRAKGCGEPSLKGPLAVDLLFVAGVAGKALRRRGVFSITATGAGRLVFVIASQTSLLTNVPPSLRSCTPSVMSPCRPPLLPVVVSICLSLARKCQGGGRDVYFKSRRVTRPRIFTERAQGN